MDSTSVLLSIVDNLLLTFHITSAIFEAEVIFMRRALVLILIIMLTLTACGVSTLPEDKVIASLPAYKTRQFYTSGGFQDYTDYGIYTFDQISEEDISYNDYFWLISDNNWEFVVSLMDDYESWVQLTKKNEPDSQLAKNYNFDRSCMNRGDYICIMGKDESRLNDTVDITEIYWNYNIYFFDVESMTLYFFHNNI